jgi:putative transcriptional regulator
MMKVSFFETRFFIIFHPWRLQEVPMKVSYDKLWKKLIDEKMNKRELMHRAKVSTNIIAKMGKEEPIALESVAKICAVFHCSVDDILELDLSTIDYEKGRSHD